MMKHYIKIAGLLLLIIIQSCGFKDQTDNQVLVETDLFDYCSNDSLRAVLFEIAYNNKSSAPSYIVFIAKDLNSGLTKEICCEAPFLSGAVHLELNIEYDSKGTSLVDSIILANRQDVFEFKNNEALRNISFNEYPNYDRIVQIANELDVNNYQRIYGRNDVIKTMYFENDTGFVQESFAHIMFKCGVITSRDCIAGNNIWFGDPNISIPNIPDIDSKIDSVDSIKTMYYTNDTIFDPIETKPIFPGGMDSLYCFIESRLNFKILNYTKQEGRVLATFKIEASGKVTNVEINPESTQLIHGVINDSLIINEFKRVLNLLPDWTPGLQKGKPVEVSYHLAFKIPYKDFKCKTMDNQTAAYWEVDKDAQFRYKEETNTKSSINSYTLDNVAWISPGDCMGKVHVRIVINEHGEVTDYFIVRGLDGCKGYNEEALRVVGLMPKWSPAVKDGKAVKSTVVIPIRFEYR